MTISVLGIGLSLIGITAGAVFAFYVLNRDIISTPIGVLILILGDIKLIKGLGFNKNRRLEIETIGKSAIGIISGLIVIGMSLYTNTIYIKLIGIGALGILISILAMLKFFAS